MTDISELLERVQNATGPDRDVDVAIMATCFDWAKAEPPYYAPHCVGDEPIYWHAPNWLQKRPCPELTASMDAALALVERVLPGWKVSLYIGHLTGAKDGSGSRAELFSPKKPKRISATDWKWMKVAVCYHAHTPALAILAALLMALSMRGGERE